MKDAENKFTESVEKYFADTSLYQEISVLHAEIDIAWTKLYSRSKSLISNLDYRANAIHWAQDVFSLYQQIVYGIRKMNAYALAYKDFYPEGTQPNSQFALVDYYASNTLLRIISCRDKIALLVWAFHFPFNPEKRNQVLQYRSILERMRFPHRFGFSFTDHEIFLDALLALTGPDFEQVERYRHLKIHRGEPVIQILGVKPHHDWPYVIPLYEEREITEFQEQQKPSTGYDEYVKLDFETNSDTLYDHRRLEDRQWNYDEVRENIIRSSIKLIQSTTSILKELLTKEPFKTESTA